MAHSKISLENDGIIKIAPVGFSWTVFFFNGFPPLIRGHVIMGVIMLVLGFFTFGVSGIILAFFYNKMYVNYLLEKGYRYKSVINGRPKEVIEANLGMELNSR